MMSTDITMLILMVNQGDSLRILNAVSLNQMLPLLSAACAG